MPAMASEELDPEIPLEEINKYSVDDFNLVGYDPHPPIKAKMAI